MVGHKILDLVIMVRVHAGQLNLLSIASSKFVPKRANPPVNLVAGGGVYARGQP